MEQNLPIDVLMISESMLLVIAIMIAFTRISGKYEIGQDREKNNK